MAEITFEKMTGNQERYWGYIPKPRKKDSTSEYRNRVKFVGTIEKHAGMYFWFMADDSDAGFSSSLEKAQQAIEDRVR